MCSKEAAGKNQLEPSPAPNTTQPIEGEQRKTALTTMSLHYDITADLYVQKTIISFQQLLEDNKIYQKMLAVMLRQPRRVRASKLLQVYQILHEDLGALKIDVEICECTICKVSIDSGS